MSNYSLLFSFFADHQYFSDGHCRGLEFVPTDLSNKLMKNTGMILRKENNGIRVFYNEDQKDSLLLFAGDVFDPLNICFKVYSSDPCFMNYTDLNIIVEDSVLYFDNKKFDHNSNQDISLTHDEYVTEKDFEKIEFSPLKKILSKEDVSVRPAFVIDVCVKAEDSYLIDDNANVTPKDYRIKFRNRKTYWKYHLLKEVKKDALYIEDQSNEIEFDKPKDIFLSGNRPAKIFRSKITLPLMEHSNYQFQLKEENSVVDKVLIKRLPVASSDQILKEIDDNSGKVGMVSEIFINY